MRTLPEARAASRERSKLAYSDFILRESMRSENSGNKEGGKNAAEVHGK